MKKNTNKKIASTVKKFVVEASIEAKNLEKKILLIKVKNIMLMNVGNN